MHSTAMKQLQAIKPAKHKIWSRALIALWDTVDFAAVVVAEKTPGMWLFV